MSRGGLTSLAAFKTADTLTVAPKSMFLSSCTMPWSPGPTTNTPVINNQIINYLSKYTKGRALAKTVRCRIRTIIFQRAHDTYEQSSQSRTPGVILSLSYSTYKVEFSHYNTTHITKCYHRWYVTIISHLLSMYVFNNHAYVIYN